MLLIMELISETLQKFLNFKIRNDVWFDLFTLIKNLLMKGSFDDDSLSEWNDDTFKWENVFCVSISLLTSNFQFQFWKLLILVH